MNVFEWALGLRKVASWVALEADCYAMWRHRHLSGENEKQ